MKVKKTYRLEPVVVERIQILKEYYSKQGFDLSDSQIIHKAISNLMDFPVGTGVFTSHPSGGKSYRNFKKEGE